MKNKEIKDWMFKFGSWRRGENTKKVLEFCLVAKPGRTLDTYNMDFSIAGVTEEGSSDKPITLYSIRQLRVKYGRRIEITTEDRKTKFFIRRIKCSPEMNEIIKDAI